MVRIIPFTQNKKDSNTKWYYYLLLAESKGFFRLRYAQLEKCQNSPPDCFSVASFVAILRVRSHFWFEFLAFELTKKDSNTKWYYYLLLAESKGFEPSKRFWPFTRFPIVLLRPARTTLRIG